MNFLVNPFWINDKDHRRPPKSVAGVDILLSQVLPFPNLTQNYITFTAWCLRNLISFASLFTSNSDLKSRPHVAPMCFQTNSSSPRTLCGHKKTKRASLIIPFIFASFKSLSSQVPQSGTSIFSSWKWLAAHPMTWHPLTVALCDQ